MILDDELSPNKTDRNDRDSSPQFAIKVSPKRVYQQKIAPRTSQTSGANYFMQVAPRVFNRQMLTARPEEDFSEKQQTKHRKKVHQNGHTPTIQTKGKREIIAKMAGVYHKGGPKQHNTSIQSKARNQKNPELKVESSPINNRTQNSLWQINPHKLSIIKESSISGAPSVEKNAQEFEDSIIQSRASRSSPPLLDLNECNTPELKEKGSETTKQKINQIVIAVHEGPTEGEESKSGDSHLILTSRNAAFDSTKPKTSVVSCGGVSVVREISEIARRNQQIEGLDEQMSHVPFDPTPQGQVSQRPMGNHSSQHSKTRNMPVWSRISPNKMSISIQNSSQIDGESSQQTARLTPMELKLPNSQQGQRSFINSGAITQQPNTPTHSLKPRLKHSLGVVQKLQEQQISSMTQDQEEPKSTLSIKIQTKNEKDSAEAVNEGSRCGDRSNMSDARQSQMRSESEMKKKAFLRQVYSNMQNSQKSKGAMYEKLSKGLRKELSNSYARRTRQDNEWQFRVMRSKLGIFESCKDHDDQVNKTIGGKDDPSKTISNEFYATPSSIKTRTEMCGTKGATKIQFSSNDEDTQSLSKTGPIENQEDTQHQMTIATQTTVARMNSTVEQHQEGSHVVSMNSDVGVMVDFSMLQQPDETLVSQVSFQPFVNSPGSSQFHLTKDVRKARPRRMTVANMNHTMRSSAEKAKDIVCRSPGSNAYLDHVQKHIQLHSQGKSMRPRLNIQEQSLTSGEAQMRPFESTAVHEGFHTARTHLRTDGRNRREVLSLDYAQDDEESKFNKTEVSQMFFSPTAKQNPASLQPPSIKATGLRTTRNSLSNQHTKWAGGSHQDPTKSATMKRLQQQFSQVSSQLSLADESQNKKSFAICRAKPTLFKPLEIEPVKIDSYVTACRVANKITKPGEPYQTTQSLSQLKTSLSKQRRASQIQRYIICQEQGQDPCKETDFDKKSTKQSFFDALDLNKQIREQNRQLRNRALSFTKKVDKKDIREIHRNLNSLNKTTRDHFVFSFEDQQKTQQLTSI